MELRDIIDSGLLELYVLNQLSPLERRMVEEHIARYPELRQEIKEIERAFFALGKNFESPVPDALKSDLISKVRGSGSNGPVNLKGSSFGPWSALIIAGILGVLTLWYFERIEGARMQQELTALQSRCDSVQSEQQAKLDIYEQLYHPGNKIMAFEATEKYPDTKLYFHYNQSTNTNFIQVLDLPDISDSRSFQLWSLSDDQPPAPLDVFEDEENLLKVQFVEGSKAYAITVEQKGGAQTPNLDQLIGIVDISG